VVFCFTPPKSFTIPGISKYDPPSHAFFISWQMPESAQVHSFQNSIGRRRNGT
jgi:hypothetical protein